MTREQLEAALGKKKTAESHLDILTDRELEVLSLMSQGSNSRFISQELHITPEELGNLKQSIQMKCKLKDEVQLIQFAARQKTKAF